MPPTSIINSRTSCFTILSDQLCDPSVNMSTFTRPLFLS